MASQAALKRSEFDFIPEAAVASLVALLPDLFQELMVVKDNPV